MVDYNANVEGLKEKSHMRVGSAAAKRSNVSFVVLEAQQIFHHAEVGGASRGGLLLELAARTAGRIFGLRISDL